MFSSILQSMKFHVLSQQQNFQLQLVKQMKSFSYYLCSRWTESILMCYVKEQTTKCVEQNCIKVHARALDEILTSEHFDLTRRFSCVFHSTSSKLIARCLQFFIEIFRLSKFVVTWSWQQNETMTKMHKTSFKRRSKQFSFLRTYFIKISTEE